MHHRIDILRVPPAPRFTPLYVYYAGTNTQIQLYSDRYLTTPITQPISMQLENINWYVAENVRVDIKMFHEIYLGGVLIIPDQMMYNPETIMNLTYTFLDGTVVLNQLGNIYTEAI